MSMSIQTNYASLVTQSNLNRTNGALTTSQQRLGTGLRINSAADDAAGLQMATRLNAQSRGMAVAMRNTNDSTSLLQTAEGSLTELTEIVQRMKDLATQSANGTSSSADRTAMQSEYDELGKEMGNIMKNTTYAGENLFGAGSGKFTAAVQFQIGGTTAQTLSLDVSTAITDLNTALGTAAATFAAAGPGAEIATQTAANTKIDALAGILDSVGALRGQFGANINRLTHTSNNLSNMRDNTEVAKGRIMDTDYAAESANMTKNQMLMQSSISMLKQANQMPGMVMSLLG